MNKLKYEQTVAEKNKRGVATNDGKPSKTKAASEKFEKDKRTTGDDEPRPTAVAAGIAGLRRKESAVGDRNLRDRAVSFVETSGCQSNVNAASAAKLRSELATLATKQKNTGIPMRQETCAEQDSVVSNANSREKPTLAKRNTISELFSLFEDIDKSPSSLKDFTENLIRDNKSHEVESSKSSKKKPGGCPKTRASCPAPSFIYKPKTKESNTSPAKRHEDGLHDEPANLICNKSTEQLPQKDTKCYSGEVDGANSDLDTVELTKNDSSDEHSDEDTFCVLENSDVTLNGERELNDVFVTSSLEAESDALLEEAEDPVVLEPSKEGPEYSESPSPSLIGTASEFESNQDLEETDEQSDEDTSRVLKNSDVTLVGERELNDVFVTSSLEAESDVLLEEAKDPVVLEPSKESLDYSELQPPSLNDTVPVLESGQEKTESTKSLRARFEALHNGRPDDRPTQKASQISQRFENLVTTKCESCEKKVYPLEKIELESKVYHKACFRCSHCQCLLRMDSFTTNCNRLFCMPHFKQLFKTKGSYDQGFGDNE